MSKLAHRVILIFITLHFANATLWWKDTGYDGLDDSPEPFATQPPIAAYDGSLLSGSPPLNATIGSGIYHLLAARQLAGCRLCANPTPVCCNNGTFCCPTGNTCQLEAGWCCPTASVACPGAPNVCKSDLETCCGGGVCGRGARCCGGTTCCSSPGVCNDSGQCVPPGGNSSSSSSSSSTSSSSSVGEGPATLPDPPSSSETSTSIVIDPPASPPASSTTSTTTPDPTTETSSVSIPDSTQVVPFDVTASLDISSPSFVDVPSNPVEPPSSTSIDPAPSDTFTTLLDSAPPAADVPSPTSSVVVETSTSNGVTLTVSHTVAPFVATASNTATNTDVAAEEASDAVALVYPWDPRIEYSPDGAWTSTTSSSSVGSCHNGTKVATQAGATIKFKFEGKQISTLICNGSKGGDYSVQVDGSPGTNLNGYKDPGSQGDQCVLSLPFNSGMLVDGAHEVSIIVKGSHAGSAAGGTAVEFGGFIYRGPHAFGTTEDSKTNIPAIVGGTVGGVVGGILIIAIIAVIVVRRRRKRNQRLDDTPAVHTIPYVSAGTPYSAVPTTEYHNPYATSGYGPGYYPNPTASTSHTSPAPGPAWRQTDTGPFGQGSYAATAY